MLRGPAGCQRGPRQLLELCFMLAVPGSCMLVCYQPAHESHNDRQKTRLVRYYGVSAACRTFRVSSFMAAPPYLTTIVLPQNFCM